MEYPYLSKIKEPKDLKNFSLSELIELASEVRSRIVEVLSVTGGHLASNLGSVELTIALHTIFESPKDAFIFDVSHQTYTHKLFTGRNDARFERIRKTGGLSGFAHPKESPHDHFFAGHAGTALSLALGMANRRDLQNEEGHIIPIIGDATLTCGLSLEALNNISRSLEKFILVLNDNEMSISENVGGITNMLSRLLNNPTTNRLVHELEALVSKIPRYGTSLAKQGLKLTESVKNLVSHAPFFEQFGLSYIGPVDGHDLKKLIPLFQAIQNLSMPVIVHLYTKKGYGISRAEKDPITYHGAKPFDPETCEFLPSSSTQPTFPKIFGKHLLEMGKRDESLVVISPAMLRGSCLDPFKEQFPKRCFDVGIAEGHAVTFSGGLAKGGKLKVVCSIYSTFLQRALDNLFQDVCLQELPVVFAIDRAGMATGDGATHSGIYEMGFLKTMPNMVICQPRDGQLLRELLESAFSWERPTAIRYPNLSTMDATLPLKPRPLGKGELLAQGDDLVIVALGHLCQTALEVRVLLEKEGISAAVVDPIFVKPLDTELFLNYTKIVTLEEHSLKGGVGIEVNDYLMRHGFSDVETLNFGVPEAFFEQGSYSDLMEEIGMTPQKITRRILSHFALTPNPQVIS